MKQEWLLPTRLGMCMHHLASFHWVQFCLTLFGVLTSDRYIGVLWMYLYVCEKIRRSMLLDSVFVYTVVIMNYVHCYFCFNKQYMYKNSDSITQRISVLLWWFLHTHLWEIILSLWIMKNIEVNESRQIFYFISDDFTAAF